MNSTAKQRERKAIAPSVQVSTYLPKHPQALASKAPAALPARPGRQLFLAAAAQARQCGQERVVAPGSRGEGLTVEGLAAGLLPAVKCLSRKKALLASKQRLLILKDRVLRNTAKHFLANCAA
jgi:hypothetical protein